MTARSADPLVLHADTLALPAARLRGASPLDNTWTTCPQRFRLCRHFQRWRELAPSTRESLLVTFTTLPTALGPLWSLAIGLGLMVAERPADTRPGTFEGSKHHSHYDQNPCDGRSTTRCTDLKFTVVLVILFVLTSVVALALACSGGSETGTTPRTPRARTFRGATITFPPVPYATEHVHSVRL